MYHGQVVPQKGGDIRNKTRIYKTHKAIRRNDKYIAFNRKQHP
jgi:hypothetical protein